MIDIWGASVIDRRNSEFQSFQLLFAAGGCCRISPIQLENGGQKQDSDHRSNRLPRVSFSSSKLQFFSPYVCSNQRFYILFTSQTGQAQNSLRCRSCIPQGFSLPPILELFNHALQMFLAGDILILNLVTI